MDWLFVACISRRLPSRSSPVLPLAPPSLQLGTNLTPPPTSHRATAQYHDAARGCILPAGPRWRALGKGPTARLLLLLALLLLYRLSIINAPRSSQGHTRSPRGSNVDKQAYQLQTHPAARTSSPVHSSSSTGSSLHHSSLGRVPASTGLGRAQHHHTARLARPSHPFPPPFVPHDIGTLSTALAKGSSGDDGESRKRGRFSSSSSTPCHFGCAGRGLPTQCLVEGTAVPSPRSPPLTHGGT